MKARTISAEGCKAFAAEILEKLGASAPTAKRWAQLMVETSLLGFDSHGVKMLQRYIRHIEGGGIKISAEPKVVSGRGVCVSMDAQYGLGHIAADKAASFAIGRAKTNGLCCVTVKNSNHIGACGLYVRRASLEDCVGICTASGYAVMAPWGGKEKLLGNNPIAVGAPIEGKGHFLFDAATSVTARGHITLAKDRGEDIPEGWALDKNGKATCDAGQAFMGTLIPVGGHKGYGLAMTAEILSSFLSGGLISCEIESWVQQTKKPIGSSFTLIVLDISSFQEVGIFKKRMADWVEKLTASAKRDGFERIYYPGEKESQTYEHRLKHGIPLDSTDEEMFGHLAAEFELEKPR